MDAMRWTRSIGVTAALLAAPCPGACGASAPPRATTSAATPAASRPADVVGVTSRAEIEAAVPAWRDAISGADPADEVARSLQSVPPGAEVDVFLGTWCGDSRREVSRLFVALALAEAEGPLPFALRFVGVDRAKQAPGLTEGVDLRYVPTVVVRREGREVGRIVETATRGVEQDLLDLLTGARTGWISLTRTP
jgi:hypothetical protein